LHLVGYLYYWQMEFNSVFKALRHKKNRRFTTTNALQNTSYLRPSSCAKKKNHA